jgi:hypothetical protein
MFILKCNAIHVSESTTSEILALPLHIYEFLFVHGLLAILFLLALLLNFCGIVIRWCKAGAVEAALLLEWIRATHATFDNRLRRNAALRVEVEEIVTIVGVEMS